LKDDDGSNKMSIGPMDGHFPDSQIGDPSLSAKYLGCEAIYIPDEAGEDPGKWHFSQKYDEGRTLLLL